MIEVKAGQIRPTGSTIIYLDPSVVETSPYQARETYSDIDELADSLLSEGQQIPIRVWFTPTAPEQATVTDGNRTYKVYCHDGNRRLAAFKLALKQDPSSVLLSKGIKAVVIPEISNEVDAVVSQYTLNNTGRGFNAIEEAKICSLLQKAGYTHQEIANKLNKSQQWVSSTLSILTYSEEVKDLIRKQLLSSTLAIELLRKAEDKAELENTLISTAKANGKVTKSLITGEDKRKNRSKKTIKVREVKPDNLDSVGIKAALELFLESTHSIASISEHELQIVVPKAIYHRLEDLID